MLTHSLESRQFVPRPLEDTFEFFSRPENLAKVTPARLDFRILTPSPIPMRVGTLIDYRIRILGIGLRWRTLITGYDPPHSFVDEQLRGPYDFWHHTHTFRAVEGGTEVGDRVVWAVGMGPIGAIANALYVRRSVEKIFEYRKIAIDRELGGHVR